VFASRLFKVLLVPVLALSIATLTGLLPLLYDNFQSQGYHLCGVEVGHGFPIPWVNSGCSCPGFGLGYVCGTNLTSYDWWIFGLDSMLCAGLGYVILFMPRMQYNEPFIGLSATYLGFFTTLTLIFINPHSLPLADLLWGSLQTSNFASFADMITTLVEWLMMSLLAYIAIFFATIIGNNLSHRRSGKPSLPALG
jgi:hypothetical protein